MEPERASFSINSRSLSVIFSIFLSHKFFFCHTDLRSSFARLLPSGRKTVAQIIFLCPAALELYIVVEVSYDQQQNYLSEDVNAHEEETIQLPEPEQLDLPFWCFSSGESDYYV